MKWAQKSDWLIFLWLSIGGLIVSLKENLMNLAMAISLGILLVGLIVCLIIFRNTLFVKKYWKYALILIPAVLVIIVQLIARRKPTEENKPPEVSQTISNVRDQLQEANMTATIEVVAARENNKDKLEELKKITQIEDQKERLRRLAELMG